MKIHYKSSLFFLLFVNVIYAQSLCINDELIEVEVYLKNQTQHKELITILPYLKKQKKFIKNIPSIFPLKEPSYFKISSLFGIRNHPIERKKKYHVGIDIASEIGTLVTATADGIIRNVAFSYTGYGRAVEIHHKYGYVTKYAHLSIIFIKNNTVIKKGEVIGMVGSTGKSTGNHLHYEIKKNNKYINPKDFFFLEKN